MPSTNSRLSPIESDGFLADKVGAVENPQRALIEQVHLVNHHRDGRQSSTDQNHETTPLICGENHHQRDQKRRGHYTIQKATSYDSADTLLSFPSSETEYNNADRTIRFQVIVWHIGKLDVGK